MDWATFFEKYSQSIFSLGGVILGSLTTLITLFVGSFFQRKSDERKRKWELEDRILTRRQDLWMSRIKDARDLVDDYHEITVTLANVLRTELLDPELAMADERIYKDLAHQYEDKHKKKISMWIINDDEINDTLKKLTSLMDKCLDELPEMSKDLDMIDKFERQAETYITILKWRLDELGEINPPAPPKWRQTVWRDNK